MPIMRLSDIMQCLPDMIHHSASASVQGVTVHGIAQDHRRIAQGELFVAIKGTRHDGAQFIDDAIAHGASAVVTQNSSSVTSVPMLRHDNTRLVAARAAAHFYAPHPSNIMAVTGTNGKTSVVEYVRQLLTLLKKPAASIGTLGVLPCDIQSNLTTPDAITLAQQLQQLHQKKIDYVALEASSHGLAQYRLDGIAIKAAALTNITRDHLDYHASFADYVAAKKRLFTDILPDDAIAVINGDDEHGSLWAQEKKHTIVYGASPRAHLRLEDIEQDARGISATVCYEGSRYRQSLPIYGTFQWHNICAAMGLLLACGFEFSQLVSVLSHVRSVRGRLQRVDDSSIYVDYAHTPDALRQALMQLRLAKGRLHVVFGCGGNRDQGKRALMGQVAEQYSDVITITDDNPRFENPEAIRRDIMAGIKDASKVTVIGSRADATRHAIAQMAADDVLLIAGKGHEREQIIGDEHHPFDDAECVRHIIKRDSS